MTPEEAQARYDELQRVLIGKVSASSDKRRFAEEMTALAAAHPEIKPRVLSAAEYDEARTQTHWGRDPEKFTPRQAEIQDALLNGVKPGPARDALLREYQTLVGSGDVGGAPERRDIRSTKSIELSERLLGMKDLADPARRALVDELNASLGADQAAADQAAANAGAGGGAA